MYVCLGRGGVKIRFGGGVGQGATLQLGKFDCAVTQRVSVEINTNSSGGIPLWICRSRLPVIVCLWSEVPFGRSTGLVAERFW